MIWGLFEVSGAYILLICGLDSQWKPSHCIIYLPQQPLEPQQWLKWIMNQTHHNLVCLQIMCGMIFIGIGKCCSKFIPYQLRNCSFHYLYIYLYIIIMYYIYVLVYAELYCKWYFYWLCSIPSFPGTGGSQIELQCRPESPQPSMFHCLCQYKWKNHFSEMEGDVGMSLHEKRWKM